MSMGEKIYDEMAGVCKNMELVDYMQCEDIQQLSRKMAERTGRVILSDHPAEIIRDGVYIWGIGALGKFAVEQFEKNNIKVKGIMTSETKQIHTTYKNIPFVDLEMISEKDPVIICCMAYPLIAEKLDFIGHKKYFYYETLPFLCKEFDSYYIGFQGMWEVLIRNRKKIKDLQILFAHDEVSLEVLKNVLLYRYTFETSYLDQAYLMSVERGNIYFEHSIVNLREDEVFIDCGGFTGDTTEAFIMHTHNQYKKILLFEPDKKIMQTAQNNLKDYKNIVFINKGIGKQEGKLFFDEKGSIGGGMMSSEGTTEIMVTSIDETVMEYHPTYIKMDIEGSESDALSGAVKTISSYRPKLAVCVYHHPQDMFELTEFIQKLGLNYKFYLRHYSRMYDDTVLYCIPE